MTKDELIALFKSGKFTVMTHDRGCFTIYKGKMKEYSNSYDAVELEELQGTDGYIPDIVALLIEALGGKSFSI